MWPGLTQTPPAVGIGSLDWTDRQTWKWFWRGPDPVPPCPTHDSSHGGVLSSPSHPVGQVHPKPQRLQQPQDLCTASSAFFWAHERGGGGKRERQTNRQTETGRDKDTETERERRDRDRQTKRDRDIERERGHQLPLHLHHQDLNLTPLHGSCLHLHRPSSVSKRATGPPGGPPSSYWGEDVGKRARVRPSALSRGPRAPAPVKLSKLLSGRTRTGSVTTGVLGHP